MVTNLYSLTIPEILSELVETKTFVQLKPSIEYLNVKRLKVIKKRLKSR